MLTVFIRIASIFRIQIWRLDWKGLFAHLNFTVFKLSDACYTICIYWKLNIDWVLFLRLLPKTSMTRTPMASLPCLIIAKTCLFEYNENFTSKKTENFHIKNSDIFLISAQNIDYGYLLEPPRWGGSNEYPRSMFLSRNKKNNVYPCKPQFYYINVGFKGVKII